LALSRFKTKNVTDQLIGFVCRLTMGRSKITKTPTIRKFVAAGRGRVIQSPRIRDAIKNLTEKDNPHVVYLGTATYDAVSPFEMQAAGFADIGCTVEHLKLTNVQKSTQTMSKIKASIQAADIIAVSGGNTLFAMKQWRKLGVDALLKQASESGTVMCGGSAGAICWFDGGHSDSRDPTTFLHVDPKLDLIL
jgi:dipeptidase E